ncbi:MAG: hypothetical protein AVDCRST_MAG02-3859, partial [uncultured Rubrobacteraceae bacterium]
ECQGKPYGGYGRTVRRRRRGHRVVSRADLAADAGGGIRRRLRADAPLHGPDATRLASRDDRLDGRVRPHRRRLGAPARVGGWRGFRRESRRGARVLRAAAAAHRRDPARGGGSDRRDARPLVARESGPLDARGGVVRRGRLGGDPV